MEQAINQRFPAVNQTVNSDRVRRTKAHFIRYADDFIILHEELSVIEQCQTLITDWLDPMGLELKASKTSITHTLHPHQGKLGFEFLGFKVQQFPVGKRHSGLDNKGQPLGFKALIQPSATAIRRHTQRVDSMVRWHRSSPQQALIDDLNPVIRGWCNYYSTVVSKKHFGRLTHILFRKLWSWARRRHPRKGAGWVRKRYWPLR